MSMDRPNGFFTAWFVFCAVLSVTVLAFGVWAVYELVTWVTAK